ncbi:hypothetical protein HDU76_005469, partial [Blyttiomyces sp. JEL0837]
MFDSILSYSGGKGALVETPGQFHSTGSRSGSGGGNKNHMRRLSDSEVDAVFSSSMTLFDNGGRSGEEG